MSLYRCPSCYAPLKRDGASYRCEAKHSFDIARKGYVNLLLAHQRASKQPGDNKMMIAARREFLSAGFYQPLSQRLVQLCRQYQLTRLLDAGCGEGYYAASLAAAGLQVAGMDISKEGVQAACRRDKNIDWSIASVAELPYLDNTFDAVLSVFCHVDEAEFARVLRPGGVVLFVGPGPNHLPNLRAALYSQVRPYRSAKQQAYFASLELLSQQALQFEIQVDSSAQIANLLKMTPHYWSTNAEQQASLLAQHQLCDQVDMSINVYQKPLP
jgi:23S rRNA (guanine745-N1)-methyltransferase